MAYETIIYEKKDKIAYITLNRPERLNAFSVQMHRELAQAWEDVKRDDNVWVIVVTGAGERAFSTGVDAREVMEYQAKGKQYPLLKRGMRAEDLRLTARQNQVWKPVVTAINGMCAGGGLHFVADTDICICSENTTFFDPHIAVAMVSALEPIGLSRRMPLGLVLRMVLMGNAERMSAQRAYEIGLVSEVVPLPEIRSTATRIAQTIIEHAPLAAQGTIEAIWKGLDMGLRDALAQGQFILAENWLTEDFVEGPRAFVEKRKPQWKAK